MRASLVQDWNPGERWVALYSEQVSSGMAEALRLLAPKRGLIATVKGHRNRNCNNLAVRKPVATRIATTGGILPGYLKFDCLPAKPGELPITVASIDELLVIDEPDRIGRHEPS